MPWWTSVLPRSSDNHPCTTVRELTQAFARADLGHLHFGKDLTIDQTTDCAHHIGTTRMASTPATGVVDRDCRVFGIHNLFIASRRCSRPVTALLRG
jgi:choline dehydrogenase-like flavoprotein